jgi:predicted phosphodiesterase
MNKFYCLATLAACFLFIGNAYASKPQNPYPRFVVISDMHFGRELAKEKVSRTLQTLLSKEPRADAIFVVGDITHRGQPEQYDDLLEVFSTHVPANIPVYFLLAKKHDHDSGPNAEKIFAEKIGQPLHQYIVLKDYPFITITQGPEGYDQTAKDFLSTHLAKAAKDFPGKPVFVFEHVGIKDTAYGTRSEDGWGGDLLTSILTAYPQVINFAGHSHYPIGDPRSIHQGQITSVNTGSLCNSEIEKGFTEGTNPPGNEDVTEGLIVTVKANGNVELERWDTFRNEEIKPRWLVKAPHDGSAFIYKNRTGGKSPVFSKNAQPTVSEITGDSCLVSFPQAKDDEVVHHYIVEAVPSDGTEPISVTVFSRFYLNSDTPKILSYRLAGLRNKTEYTVKVTAVDSYNNRSEAIWSRKFKMEHG